MEWTGEMLCLEPGPHYALDVQSAFIHVDTSEVWETGPAESQVHLSYWLPSNTQDGEKVPVIAVISSYYSFGQPGSESGATDVVGSGRGNLSTIISFHTAMLLPKYLFLELNYPAVVLTTEGQRRSWNS